MVQRYDFYLSCARVWGEKLCKAREKSINLFICFSEPQPILCKSEDLTGVFNSCWMFGRAKCGDYKPKRGRYQPYWRKWMDGIIFVASLWTSGRADCEVDAGIYEVGLHDMGYFLTQDSEVILNHRV